MIVREIVLTCSNPHVARAAVASIGREFADRFERDATRLRLSSGLYAAKLVKLFSHLADDADWEGVDDATRGADLPILTGLRFILERGMEMDGRRRDPSRHGWFKPGAACGEGTSARAH